MKLRQQAFIDSKKMLRGCLHCHSTRSDGKVDPADVIRFYHAHGYDFLALTDHRNYNFTNFAPEIPLTIIPAMEYDNTFLRDNGFRTFHTVCIGPAKEDGNGFEQDERPDSGKAKNQSEYQAYLDDIHAKGNLTIHCHPQWSSTPASYFGELKGNFAMEIWNSACAMGYDSDNDAAYWDELLGQGKVIYGVATDDAHAERHFCNGWVMVNAENNIRAILDALKEGKFYASCGPEIYDFYVEDNTAVVECSPAVKVRFQSDMHPNRIVRSEDGTLTRAEFSLLDKNGNPNYKYIRASVVDSEGKKAWTNPIFLK